MKIVPNALSSLFSLGGLWNLHSHVLGVHACSSLLEGRSHPFIYVFHYRVVSAPVFILNALSKLTIREYQKMN